MQVKAKAKYIRISPRKVRLVVDLVRGLPVKEAQHQLMFSKKRAARPVLKVLNSAIANAENNFGLNTKDFIVAEAFVDEGPTLKRYMPRAFGRASTLRKRSSHITILVGERTEEKASKKAKETAEEKPAAAKKEEQAVEKKAAKKPAAKKAKPATKKKAESK